MYVTTEAFVEAWETSSSIHEVQQRLRMKRNAIIQRAYQLRKKGARLKPLDRSGKPPVNIDAVNKLIDRIHGGNK